jgi:stearoyl-CoA desaturase (delta-9 desaturase)
MSPNKSTLITWHVLAHCALVYFIYTGTAIEWFLAIFLYIIQSTISGTVIYHRLLSHRSFSSPRWFTILGSIIGSLGGNGSGLAWAAVHREHHRFTDRDRDPHCPHRRGVLWTQFASFMHNPNIRYVPDLLRDRVQVKIHEFYWAINFIYILALLSIDHRSIFYAYFVPALFTWHAGSFINTLGHMSGYTNYSISDTSKNNIFTGYLVGGEGWHNNHHADPANARFGRRWWEFDLGYLIIKLIRIDNENKDNTQ